MAHRLRSIETLDHGLERPDHDEKPEIIHLHGLDVDQANVGVPSTSIQGGAGEPTIFNDDFESGDLSAWSGTAGG